MHKITLIKEWQTELGVIKPAGLSMIVDTQKRNELADGGFIVESERIKILRRQHDEDERILQAQYEEE